MKAGRRHHALEHGGTGLKLDGRHLDLKQDATNARTLMLVTFWLRYWLFAIWNAGPSEIELCHAIRVPDLVSWRVLAVRVRDSRHSFHHYRDCHWQTDQTMGDYLRMAGTSPATDKIQPATNF